MNSIIFRIPTDTLISIYDFADAKSIINLSTTTNKLYKNEQVVEMLRFTRFGYPGNLALAFITKGYSFSKIPSVPLGEIPLLSLPIMKSDILQTPEAHGGLLGVVHHYFLFNPVDKQTGERLPSKRIGKISVQDNPNWAIETQDASGAATFIAVSEKEATQTAIALIPDIKPAEELHKNKQHSIQTEKPTALDSTTRVRPNHEELMPPHAVSPAKPRTLQSHPLLGKIKSAVANFFSWLASKIAACFSRR